MDSTAVNTAAAGARKTAGTSVFENGMIWFGAAISIAEIITGTYFAPLGFGRGLTAILLGHLIGCALLFLAGVIGGKTRLCAMDTVKRSFGQRGGRLFAFLNVIQLVGWTAIMIYDGSLAAHAVWDLPEWFWAGVIGALIVVWLLVGLKNLGKLNIAAVGGLFALTLMLSVIIFRSRTAPAAAPDGSISFGAALELSIAMPLSWLPLISDYTREAARPVKATFASALIYGIGSCWMYAIGMGAAILTGESSIARVMLKSGLGILALLIVIFSTVTTTFLDAFSAGISAESIHKALNAKNIAIITTLAGTIGAIVYPMDNITNFLYFIGSVFAPMISVLAADYFILRRRPSEAAFDIPNLVIWLVGFIVYRVLISVGSPIGSTIPAMLLTFVLCLFVHLIRRPKRPA